MHIGGSTGKLAAHFLEIFKKQQSAVVVSQNWSEIRKVNEQVRFGLKAQKLIGDTETAVTALERQDLTDAQNATSGFTGRFQIRQHWKITRCNRQTSAD